MKIDYTEEGLPDWQYIQRIKELEDGSCRFNCRKEKEAFIAGALAAFPDWPCVDPGEPELTYKQWRKERS